MEDILREMATEARAYAQVSTEYPDWSLEEIKQAVASVSPSQSPEARAVRERYHTVLDLLRETM